MLKISAQVSSRLGENQIILKTNESEHSIVIAPKSSGYGLRANGGELLFLALAACYCNDIYREAAARGISVHQVEVAVRGDFSGAPGGAAQQVRYDVRVEAEASADAIANLIRHTDTVAEIHNTLRRSTAVTLDQIEAIPI